MPEWRIATVEEVRVETERTRSFRLSVPGFGIFRPGQHVDVRLTAPDGYQAQRSYSIASAPGEPDSIELTIELIDDGEVSPYFHQVIQRGDQFEVRGPIGGPFTWTRRQRGPLLLIAGGSGIVPLMSMLRHREAGDEGRDPAALLYSSRSLEDVIYRDEIDRLTASDVLLHTFFALTRSQPPGWSGFGRRVDSSLIQEVIEVVGSPAASYVCGPTEFVETAASLLVDAGISPATIRTERFGPSGN